MAGLNIYVVQIYEWVIMYLNTTAPISLNDKEAGKGCQTTQMEKGLYCRSIIFAAGEQLEIEGSPPELARLSPA